MPLPHDSSGEPSVTILQRGGRPRLGEEPLTTFSMRLPNAEADYVIRVATRAGVPVSRLLREIVVTCVHAQVLEARFRTKP